MPPQESDGQEPGGVDHPGPTARRRTASVLVLAAAIATLGLGMWRFAGEAVPDSGSASASRPATVAAKVATITKGTDSTGTLAYGTSTPVLAPSEPGVLTWLPRQGRTLKPGDVLYRLNDDAVTYFAGRVPMYRDLSVGTTGPDVRQLEANLRRLGYVDRDDLDVDQTYSYATQAAVARWQRDTKQSVTGYVPSSSVVFLPMASIRVGQTAHLGALTSPGSQVLAVTSTKKQITVNVDLGTAYDASVGDRVPIIFPDGTRGHGTIIDVSSDVSTDASESEAVSNPDGGRSDSPPELAITIRPSDPGQARRWGNAPVTVTFITLRRRHVVAIPVTALVANGDGGYSVDVVTASGVQKHDVRIGVVSGDLVEITEGLEPGQEVVVAQ